MERSEVHSANPCGSCHGARGARGCAGCSGCAGLSDADTVFPDRCSDCTAMFNPEPVSQSTTCMGKNSSKMSNAQMSKR